MQKHAWNAISDLHSMLAAAADLNRSLLRHVDAAKKCGDLGEGMPGAASFISTARTGCLFLTDL